MQVCFEYMTPHQIATSGPGAVVQLLPPQPNSCWAAANHVAVSTAMLQMSIHKPLRPPPLPEPSSAPQFLRQVPSPHRLALARSRRDTSVEDRRRSTHQLTSAGALCKFSCRFERSPAVESKETASRSGPVATPSVMCPAGARPVKASLRAPFRAALTGPYTTYWRADLARRLSAPSPETTASSKS